VGVVVSVLKRVGSVADTAGEEWGDALRRTLRCH